MNTPFTIGGIVSSQKLPVLKDLVPQFLAAS